MIDCNSNCSRVDAVKALATQLELQSNGKRPAERADGRSEKVKSDLQALDEQIKTGDAKKAEAALAVAKKDLNSAPVARTRDASSAFNGLDVYA